jgi:hypothetical protein
MSDSFQIVRGTQMRPFQPPGLFVGADFEAVLIRMTPESTIAVATAGTMSRNRVACSVCRTRYRLDARRGGTSCGRRWSPRRPPAGAA